MERARFSCGQGKAWTCHQAQARSLPSAGRGRGCRRCWPASDCDAVQSFVIREFADLRIRPDRHRMGRISRRASNRRTRLGPRRPGKSTRSNGVASVSPSPTAVGPNSTSWPRTSIAAWLRALPPIARDKLSARIGGHVGSAIVSRLGSAQHQHVAATGDTVNVASRLLEVAKQQGARIVVS
jgi:hypothetical protein